MLRIINNKRTLKEKTKKKKKENEIKCKSPIFQFVQETQVRPKLTFINLLTKDTGWQIIDTITRLKTQVPWRGIHLGAKLQLLRHEHDDLQDDDDNKNDDEKLKSAIFVFLFLKDAFSLVSQVNEKRVKTQLFSELLSCSNVIISTVCV